MRDPRRAYRVVDAFEEELCDYTGARHAVAVNSCTNALFLALTVERMAGRWWCSIPNRTYVGVAQAARNAGFEITYRHTGPFHDWQPNGWYRLAPTDVVDSARHIAKGMYQPGRLVCLSLHVAKQLPVGRGGVILTDNELAAEWFRAARMDGRPPGSNGAMFPGWHMPMPPDVAARGLDILSRWNDADYSPPPLPVTNYPDLCELELGVKA